MPPLCCAPVGMTYFDALPLRKASTMLSGLLRLKDGACCCFCCCCFRCGSYTHTAVRTRTCHRRRLEELLPFCRREPPRLALKGMALPVITDDSSDNKGDGDNDEKPRHCTYGDTVWVRNPAPASGCRGTVRDGNEETRLARERRQLVRGLPPVHGSALAPALTSAPALRPS
jgi:hypothetical protein